MPPKTFQKSYACRGMALSLPIDAQPELKHKFLQNIRVTADGAIESRPRLSDFISLTGSADLIHTIRKLIDSSSGDVNYLAGAGTKLFTGVADPLAEKATGFSGNPLSIVNYKPEESAEIYAYIADENKFVKVSASDILSNVGLDPPNAPIQWELAAPVRKILDNLTAGTLADWAVTNGVATIQSRVNTTVSQYLPDGALPNYVSIVPVAFSAEMQEGAILTVDGVDVVVEKVVPTGLAAGIAIIAAIEYESGSTGFCHITLSVPVTEIFRDSILLLDGTEYVRVIDVIRGNDGIPVIYTSTVGTFAAADTVSGVASFRVYTSTAFAPTDALVADGLRDAIAASGISNLTKVADYDLTNASGKPLSSDAVFHASLKLDDLADINEIQILLGFDTGFVDYLRFVVSPNFLAESILQTSSTISTTQSALQRRQIIRGIDDYVNDSDRRRRLDEDTLDFESTDFGSGLGETILGQGAWTELFIPFHKFERIGADASKTRKDVKAIRISIDAKDATNVYIDSIWVGGASGANSVGSTGEALLLYNYVYRFRDPATRNISNPSPPLREGLRTRRNDIVLSIPTNSLPEDYRIDIFRIGGGVNDWRALGSIPNDGSTFTDNKSDDLIADNEKLGRGSTDFSIGDFDYFKPFAFLDGPKTGECDVVGTELTITSGDQLDLSYPRGTKILVDGQLTKFYSSPSTVDKASLEDNLGTLSGVTFEIREPLLTGQPLPILAGPFGEGFFGLVIFGAGNLKAPGTVYWLDPSSPDTQSDINYREITSPSEPIMAIVIYDSFAFVYTTKRSFTLSPYDAGGYLDFRAQENANSKGIFCRKGICVARTYIYQLAEDGIYRSEGVGNPQSITDEDLHSLFPHNGVMPSSIVLFGQTIYPPDYTKPDEMWLMSTEDHIFWRFVDTNNQQICLVYDTRLEGWISRDTFVDNKIGAIYKLEDESATDILAGQEGEIRRFVDADSAEDDLQSWLVPFVNDLGDFRSLKRFYEVTLDTIAGEGLTVRTSFDNANFPLADVLIGADLNRNLSPIELSDGEGTIARNISNFSFWPLSSGARIFKEAIYYEAYDAKIVTNASEDFGLDTFFDKFWQGLLIEADTFGLDKTLEFYDDDDNLKATLTINHSRKMIRSYSFALPFISHKLRRASSDGIAWIPYNEAYVFDREPELADVWESQFISHGIDGWKQLKQPKIVVASTDVVRVIFNLDGEELEYEIPSTGGIKRAYQFHIAARKWGLIKYRLESDTKFRNYKKDHEVWIRKWNSEADWQVIKPFGAEDNLTEVQI